MLQGLAKSFSLGTVVCAPITAQLVISKLKVSRQLCRSSVTRSCTVVYDTCNLVSLYEIARNEGVETDMGNMC
jgi:hypothetical protein